MESEEGEHASPIASLARFVASTSVSCGVTDLEMEILAIDP